MIKRFIFFVTIVLLTAFYSVFEVSAEKQPTPIPCKVIVPEECRTCNTQPALEQLKSLFPGLEAQFLEADTPKAQNLIKDANITMLPAYFLTKQIENQPVFGQFGKFIKSESGKSHLKISQHGE